MVYAPAFPESACGRTWRKVHRQKVPGTAKIMPWVTSTGIGKVPQKVLQLLLKKKKKKKEEDSWMPSNL
jgi:trans-aconitate methyltransferase